MKKIKFLGSSLSDIKNFPLPAIKEVGHELRDLQKGQQPSDYKPMPSIAKGVEELRIKIEDGQFRVIYFTRYKEMIFVLHAFQKKTQKTSLRDISLAKTRFKLIKEIENG